MSGFSVENVGEFVYVKTAALLTLKGVSDSGLVSSGKVLWRKLLLSNFTKSEKIWKIPSRTPLIFYSQWAVLLCRWFPVELIRPASVSHTLTDRVIVPDPDQLVSHGSYLYNEIPTSLPRFPLHNILSVWPFSPSSFLPVRDGGEGNSHIGRIFPQRTVIMCTPGLPAYT